MATVLQRQLAEIAANSTHQLDLKAQKTQHARSLLFDAGDAARQSFDAIYQLCREGFDELCQLDARFLSFANNLFAIDSKSVDRGQLTQDENFALDRVIESFLGLLHGRLLLKPAQKSLEWLVRRWRVQEFTPVALLLTVLPYHKTESLFPAVLALLPEDRELPEAFKWLHPYVASRACPPEHAVLAAAISNRPFFSAFNAYTLRTARAGHASGILLAYWAGLLLKVVNGMLDSSRSGRASIREQKEQDVLLTTLPILRDAFDISKRLVLDEMYIGACMVAMLLATRAELADSTLDALMETVSNSWSVKTVTGGLSCLMALAEAKDDLSIPLAVTLQMLNAKSLSMITQLAHSQRVSKLAVGFALGLIQSSQQQRIATHLHVVRDILEADILQRQHTARIVEELVACTWIDDAGLLNEPTRELLTTLNEEKYQGLLESSLRSSTIDPAVRKALINGQDLAIPHDKDSSDDEMEMVDAPEINISGRTKLKDVAKLLDDLPQLPHEQYSFTDPSANGPKLFNAFLSIFSATTSSKGDEQLFMDRVLGEHTSQSSVTLLSFLARVWSTASSHVSVRTKVEALDCANLVLRDCLRADWKKSDKAESHVELADPQALYPYLLVALTDGHQHIRAAAGRVWMSLDKLFTPLQNQNDSKTTIWAKETFYGAKSAATISHLSANDSARITSTIVSVLDDCLLDAGFLKQYFGEMLSTAASDSGENRRKPLSKEQRNAVRDFLSSHAMTTLSMRTRLVLLRILSAISKGADTSRIRHVLPLLKEWASASEQDLEDICKSDGVGLYDIDYALLDNMWHCTGDAIQQAREVCLKSSRQKLTEMAFEQQQRSWPLLKSTQARLEVVQWLLNLVLDQNRYGEDVAELASQTLKMIEMTPEVLLAMFDTLPRAVDLQNQPPPSKKQRRISDAAQSRPVAQEVAQTAIRKITLVLELLEQSQPSSSKFLQPLFQLLAELRHFKAVAGSDLTYLHAMTLDALLSIVRKVQERKEAGRSADWNFIRIDLLIDCIRTSSSPQVQDTAVLLVSALASWIPDGVLHSVMPLFTFMSTTILQRNDEYSAHITEQAIARIVPALALSLRSRGQSVLLGVSEMLLSFVAAWEHVPLHRRLLTFDMVVDAIGTSSCLGAISAMLAERYPETGVPVSNFIVDLIARRSAAEIVTAANQWLELVTQGLQASNVKKSRTPSVSDVLFGMSDKDEDEKTETLEKLIDGLRNMLRNDEIKKALAISLNQKNADELHAVYSAYASLLENAIRLTQNISNTTSLDSNASSQLLSAVLDLLPTPDFIASSAEIMQAGSNSSREMVFRSLESRVQACRSNNVAQSETFINLLPSCAVFVRPDQAVNVVAAAISCIDAICDKFGKTNPMMVRDAADAVAGEAGLGSNSPRLRTLSLLCLASIVGVLEDGDESLLVIPHTLSFTLDLLASTTASSPKVEQDAGFRFLTAVLDHSPWMLTTDPKKFDQALQCGARADSNQSEAVHDFLLLAARIPAAVELFASIERVFIAELQEVEAQLSVECSSALRSFPALIDVFHQAVAVSTKATVTKNASTIFRLLLSGFDLPRRLSAVVQESETVHFQDLNTKIGNVALDVTLKMNDATFRPFFIQLVDWATSSSSGLDRNEQQKRTVCLYRFALLLFDRLGALVVSYMSFLLESTQSILLAPAKTATETELLHLVVKALDSSFRRDEDDFWTAPAHFDRIEDALISRLTMIDRQATTETEMQVESISNLAAAVNASPEQLKRINTHLLAILRHQHADVRLAALQCQRAITSKVNFDWLALLPEMLPVISELQEDDDERVERETLRWVKEIEDISGESLEGMLA